MTNDKNNKGNPAWAQMVREIPDYATAEEPVRPMMDEIIARNDPHDLDAMRSFGDEAQDELRQVSDEILAAQEGEGFEALSEPLEKAAGFMENLDIDAIGASLASMGSTGMKVALRNKGLLAAAAAASFVVGPLALLGGGGMIAAKEAAKKAKQKFAPETLEQMEERLRDGIAAFKPMIAELETAREGLPALRQNIQGLGAANMKALVRTTVFIGAGREIERRIVEEELPAHQDNEEAVETLTQARALLAAKIANLEQSRNGAIRDITVMGNLMKAVDDNDLAVQSILTQEIHNHRANLAAQKTTADVLRFSRVVNEFREKTEGDIKSTIKATQSARQIAAANRSDSPERLQAALESMNQVKKLLDKAIKALPAAEKQKETLRGKLTAATTEVVDTQVSYAHAVNNNRQLTTGAPLQKQALLKAPEMMPK